MSFAKVNGITLYYEVHGTGKPVVVINGLADDLSELAFITKALAKKYRVLAFDNRGAGRSDKPDEPYSIAQMASDTAAVMRQAGFESAYVLGISMGGRIALELALECPNMIKKLVLVSTAARIVPSLYRTILFSTLPRLPLFKGAYPQPYYAFARQREASRSYDCTSRLHELRAPMLIMHGRKDTTTPLALAEELHAGITGSEMQVFSGGHLFFLIRERQEFLNKAEAFIG